MPVASNNVPRPVRQAGILAPLVLAILVFGAIVVFGVAHLAAKGSGPAAHATQAQMSQGQVPERGPYNAQDFSEPKNK